MLREFGPKNNSRGLVRHEINSHIDVIFSTEINRKGFMWPAKSCGNLLLDKSVDINISTFW